MLEGSTIILGVSGSIAAYKAVYLLRRLVEASAIVHPILTQAATRFVAPLSFSILSGHRAVVDMWSASEAGEVNHVELAHKADLLLLAPATADLLARACHGRADDPLMAVSLATRAPWVIAPAMETGMWNHAETQTHVHTLTKRGVRFVMPDSGGLASGAQGVGRMAEPEAILEAVRQALTAQDLRNKRVVVTAGPTREAFDPVRFVTNASSGKMGYALARVAARRGADVTLISGPTNLAAPLGVKTIPVITTHDMLHACEQALPNADVLVMAAAPVDHRPVDVAEHKVKKLALGTNFDITMESTPDILRTLSPLLPEKVAVGFAAETDHLVAHAIDKLRAKNLDLIVANDVRRPGAGFGVDTNAVTILDREGTAEELPLMSKEAVATEILNRVAKILSQRSG